MFSSWPGGTLPNSPLGAAVGSLGQRLGTPPGHRTWGTVLRGVFPLLYVLVPAFCRMERHTEAPRSCLPPITSLS